MCKEVQCGAEVALLQMWDTMGQERFDALGKVFFRGADCVVLCFDITRRPTFERVLAWDKIVCAENNENEPNVTPAVRILIGCKSDRDDERVVQYAEAAAMAQEHGWMYFETSAKTGANVEDAFHCLATLAYSVHMAKKPVEAEVVDVGEPEQTHESICSSC